MSWKELAVIESSKKGVILVVDCSTPVNLN